MELQKIDLAYEITKKKVIKFKNLNGEEKKRNLFLLRSSLDDIISYLNYFLFIIGKKMDIYIDPNHPLRKKQESLEYLSNIFSKENKRFLDKSKKYRNTLAHKGDFFPNIKETEDFIEEFKLFGHDVEEKASNYSVSKKSLLEKIYKISIL